MSDFATLHVKHADERTAECPERQLLGAPGGTSRKQAHGSDRRWPLSIDESTDASNLEHAIRLIRKGGATLEQAAAQYGLDPAALQAQLSGPAPSKETESKKPPSRFEVTFWLPY